MVPPLTLSPTARTFPPTLSRRLLHPHHRTYRPTEQCACALSKPYHELKSPPAANPRCAHSFYGVRPFSRLSPFEPVLDHRHRDAYAQRSTRATYPPQPLNHMTKANEEIKGKPPVVWLEGILDYFNAPIPDDQDDQDDPRMNGRLPFKVCQPKERR